MIFDIFQIKKVNEAYFEPIFDLNGLFKKINDSALQLNAQHF